MRIDSLQGFLQTGEVAGQSPHQEERAADQFLNSPASWGADSVNISAAARDAQQAAKSETKTDGDDAVEAFRKYMHKARGGMESSSGGSLESLKARLKDLQSKLSAIAGNPHTPEQTKSSMITAIQAEIHQIISQIAELEAQAAKSG